MKTLPTIALSSLAFGLCAFSDLSAQTLYLNYNFNGSASSTADNAGQAANAQLVYHDASKVVGNMYSGPGTGVSGASGDTALNNTSAGAMGTLGNNAAGASTAAKSVDLGTMGSFTVAGWFWADSTPGSNAKLFELSGTESIAVVAEANQTGRLALTKNGGVVSNSTSQSGYSTTGSWIFWAVTYDGTTSSNNLNFYLGTTNGALSLTQAGSRSVTGGNISFGSEVGVGIGNGYYASGAANRPFDGLIDDIYFYGSGAGTSSGALSAAQIDALRLQAIPEPSTAILLLGGVSLGVFALRRRKKEGGLKGK